MKKCSAKILDTTLPHEKTPVPKEVKSIPLSMNDFKKFKYIENISKRYEFGDYLGQGAFGKVLKCTLKDTGNKFAIKIIEKEMVKKRKVFLQLLENELSILGSKCHPKIIRIVDLLEDNENYYIVSEIVEGGELFNRLRTLDAFTEDQAVNIIWQVMLGLNYLHL
jgi:serine/threonine protein kinase